MPAIKCKILVFPDWQAPQTLSFGYSSGKIKPLRERPFNLKGGYGFFLKKYSDSQWR
jgi:hypothetical protein